MKFTPAGVGFYPRDISRREIDTWTKKHLSQADQIWDPYTVVVRRNQDLAGIPYSKADAKDLKAAAKARSCARASRIFAIPLVATSLGGATFRSAARPSF